MGNFDRFFDRYYGINFVVIFSYFVVRTYYPNSPIHIPGEWWGLTREQEIGAIAGVALFQRYMKTTTIDEFIQSAILFGKTTVVAEMYFTDRRVMAWYLIIYLIMFFMVSRRRFEGERDVRVLNPVSLKNRVLQGPPDVLWVVLFRASWSGMCDNFDPVFADLSLKYTTNKLKFAEVDVARWPEAAKDFGIDTSGSSLQLPSVILFENNAESRRLPPVNPDGTVKATKLDRAGVIKYFYLDRAVISQSQARQAAAPEPRAASIARKRAKK